MKRLIPILASAASMTIPVAAMADNIVCHGGWSIERHVTGSASSGFMSYMKDVGVINYCITASSFHKNAFRTFSNRCIRPVVLHLLTTSLMLIKTVSISLLWI
ncbi:hypothetical protein [Escherichia coli]|uniref:hypothetical protein n=1 Tax=Escherichia coli TaxID=562 RepID=UPI00201A438A|nr:hypothetical protein [Escherichia coli]